VIQSAIPVKGRDLQVIQGDSLNVLRSGSISQVHLTFLDPPYNQGKDYKFFDDNQPEEKYWDWMREIAAKVRDVTVEGGALYFMHREKNAERVLRILRETGWTFRNLIIWKKRTSAVPGGKAFSKHYQIIVFVSNGPKVKTFNRLRVDLPLPPEYKNERENGVYLSDVWDDIRELTSGFFAGDEALRDARGKRIHVQQSPIALLLRIILSSSLPHDTILDPLAGTGTTAVVASQLSRNAIAIEIDPENVKVAKKRLEKIRSPDNVLKYHDYYQYTPELAEIWPAVKLAPHKQQRLVLE
jgi:site-specific DNA-methyltransferase (adenine-specific)